MFKIFLGKISRVRGFQEAANREWELKGQEAATEAVGIGLREVLRAAGGRGGRNGGVVDLMLR